MTADNSFEALLQQIPKLDLASDGDCQQAVGLDLPVAVINLAHRTDKWQAVSGRMASIGLDKLIKIPAVEGAKLPLAAMKHMLGQPIEVIEAAPRSHFTLTRPAVGCYLSHLAVWRWMIDNKLPRIVVFEDDANPAADFDRARFRSVMGSLPEDAGMVLLGRIIMDGMADTANGADLARIYFFNGTFAYSITPAAAKALIPLLLPLNGHIDHQISTFLVAHRREIAAHYVEPAFFEPDWSLRSDCYVPLEEVPDADRALGALLTSNRQLLLDDGRPLRSPHV